MEGVEDLADGQANEITVNHPQKKYFRQRAHCNPLSQWLFDYPSSPNAVDWAAHYPKLCGDGISPRPKVEIADIGCGFGGLLVGLAPVFPSTLMMGMEIREKVTEYVEERIKAFRLEQPGKFDHVSVVRTNAMKYLSRFFEKGQLSKMFFCFPDPHFKRSNHRRRIINAGLLAEYAYVLRVGGIAYSITDVEELHLWMKSHFEEHPLFESLTDEEIAADPAVAVMKIETEEGKKVAREGKFGFVKYVTAFRRIKRQRE